MWGLIKKDLLIIISNIRTLIFLVIVYGGMAISGDFNFSYALSIVGVMLLLTTFSYDEYNHFDAYSISLPGGKKNFVKSKYMAGLLVSVISTTLAMLLTLAGQIYTNMINLEELFIIYVSSLMICLVTITIMFPLLLKYGVEKGRLMIFLVAIIPSVGLSLLVSFLQERNIDMSFFENISDNTWGIIIAISSILFFVISYLISEKLYKKKEF